MSRNGSGTYSLPSNSWNPSVNGVPATAADWQTLINDVASALTQSVSKDGQTPLTGNLAAGGNKLTGLSAGSAAGDSLRFEQLFSQGALTDIASAATTDIGAQLSTMLRVTGTTGITSFGANYNGPRFMIFAGVVTLTHSATLVLPGAANITTAANDALIAVPISGGWQVVAYTRAAGLPAVAGPLAGSGITGAAASGSVTASGLTQTTGKLLGRTTASTGAIEEITAGAALSLTGGTLDVASAGITPAKLSQPITLGTLANTTSGTSVTIGSIPSWAKRVTLMLNGVKSTGTSAKMVRLGVGGTPETTNYFACGMGYTGAAVSAVTYTAGFGLNNTNNSTDGYYGSLIFTHMGGDVWTLQGSGSCGTVSTGFTCSGTKDLAGVLDSISITTVGGTDTFTAGSINVLYE